MREFGIIGYPLGHSFSARYFSEKFAREHIDARFEMYPLQSISELEPLLGRVPFAGMNVTQPYKVAVMEYLDSLDETAREIGAVNVIRFHQGRRIGYNTDCQGFIQSIRPALRPSDRHALVLGTGGAAKAVTYALRTLGLTTEPVSRDASRGLPYERLTADIMAAHTVVVNCTPLGMYPATEACPPIPYEHLTEQHLLFDCIYNPEETLFLRRGAAQGCRTMNGMGMLYGQAEAAWEIWNKE